MFKSPFGHLVKASIDKLLLVLPFAGRAAPDVRRFRSLYSAIAEETGSKLQSHESIPPQFTADGTLAAGVYHANWQQFEERFGNGSARRRKLIAGLMQQCHILRQCGCRRIVIGGSFVSQKKRPRDFDGCFDVDGIDGQKLRCLDARFFHNQPSDSPSLQREFGGTLVPWIYLYSLNATTAEFLQYDIRQGKRKGIVIVNLA